MTLKSYDPGMLDQFALRLLDLAAMMRKMSQNSREYGIHDFALHDKKANEWIANLERWGQRSQADLEIRILEVRATRRAASAAE